MRWRTLSYDPNGSNAGGGPCVSWFCVCTDELFFVLAGDINVLDCQQCRAGQEEVNVVIEYYIAVIIIASIKLIGVTIQLGWEIKFGVISGLILVSLDMSKRRW